MIFTTSNFVDLSQTEHESLFADSIQVWDALTRIGDYLRDSLKPNMQGTVLGQPFIGSEVAIGSGTIIEPGVVIIGPAWIGKNCRLRSGCYLRENVIVGNHVVLGNSCEFKNCVIFNNAQIPHFNYVGDSIVGYKAHLAAGVILSNVRLDKKEISVNYKEDKIATGLKKFGAIIGDMAEIGCNSVISPGSLIGRGSLIYPLTHFGGVLPEQTVLKVRQQYAFLPRR